VRCPLLGQSGTPIERFTVLTDSKIGSAMLKLPPPIWTLIYIVVSATISWLLGWPTPPGLPLPPLGIGLVAVAFIPPVWAIVLFRREGTEVNPTSPANRKLITSGPYQFTRNPMYLGLVIVALGIALWVGAWPMFIAPVATFATANWVHIPFEEAKMRHQFGATYEDYVERVPRWV
jgi:protein-S-isoprenylcysteine O-methyltransferase Ste14